MGRLNKSEPQKRQLSPGQTQNLLKEEILQLQKELEYQTTTRSALEKAMNCDALSDDPLYKSLSKPAEDLIKEIAVLELEVVYLEKYLLSMYRRNFAKKPSNLPTVKQRAKSNAEPHNWKILEASKTNLALVNEDPFISCSKLNDIFLADNLIDNGIYRCQSSLSQNSACSFISSPRFQAVAETLDSYHSLPLSMLERAHNSNSNPSLGQYLGSSFSDRFRETPNWISEEMIKCISTIYCHISDPPLFKNGFDSFSPNKFSPRKLSRLSCEDSLSLNSWLNSNHFHVETSKEFSGSLFNVMEVKGICRDSQKLDAVEDLLQNFRFLISKLSQVDPGKLKHEEKLAFWINVHNALVMHAFLVYGIPRGNLKRISLVLKAAYDIGGRTISVDTIQSSILGCRLPRPSQWLHSLFFPKAKFKSGDPRKSYAIKHTEPRLRFSLCSGCRSDPPVRLYTPKKVFQDLEIAKEEYIQTNVKLHKEQRLLIPKSVDYFAKEMGLSSPGVAEMLELSMPDSLRKKFEIGKRCKKIDWIPHDFTFRFLLLLNELVG